MTEVSTADRAAYYAAALRLLRFVEARAPTQRRFGSDADALWKGFAGGLQIRDRIDVLVRDADTAWPGAFGARSTFNLLAVAEDDAFGADWASLEAIDGEQLWRTALQAKVARDVRGTIAALADAWGLRLTPCELPDLGPSARLVIGGASAIAAAIDRFAANEDLSWQEQVVVVADRPAERQLAAAGTALLDESAATRLRGSDDRSALPGYQAFLSADATPEVRAAVRALAAS